MNEEQFVRLLKRIDALETEIRNMRTAFDKMIDIENHYTDTQRLFHYEERKEEAFDCSSIVSYFFWCQ